MLLPTYARLLGLLIGAQLQCDIKTATPLAHIGFGRIERMRLTALPRGFGNRTPLPMQAASISGIDVELGWKAPALLLVPYWIIFRPTLLPLLLIAWLKLPNSGRGFLDWDGSVEASSLNRGAWKRLLGLVLDGIGRNSLPGMLATLNPADGTYQPMKLPRSVCNGVSVEGSWTGGKLILDGRTVQRRGPSTLVSADGGMTRPIVDELQGPLDYTLRLGLKTGVVESDGTVLVDAIKRGRARSCLVWDNPELKLSLGDGPLARLLPQLWVPVAASCCVPLPRNVELLRATVSEAGDAVSAGGTLAFGPAAPEEYGLVLRS